MNILGVKIDNTNLEEIIEKISIWINGEEQNKLFTVNAEFILEAQRNQEFKDVLNNSSLNTCDGSGPMWAGKFLHGQKLTRVTGVDLTATLLQCHPERNAVERGDPAGLPRSLELPRNDKAMKIYLLGGSEGVAQAVKNKYCEAPIVGAESGGKLKAGEWKLENNNQTIDNINNSGANVLLVAFGQVRQEMWIEKNLPLMPGVKVAMGIGGTFDFLSGQIQRAPKWLRKLGLEWLFRLIKQPSRIGRIWNAVVIFGLMVLREKFYVKK